MPFKPIALLCCLSFGLIPHVYGQFTPSVRSAAWAGGGFSMVGGPEAAVMNPANLMIIDHRRMTRLQLPSGMVYMNDFNWFDEQALQERYYSRFFDDKYTFSNPQLTQANRELVLTEWFGEGDIFQRDSGWDVMLFALSGKSKTRGWSLFARSRGINSTRISKDWFVSATANPTPDAQLNRLFHQQFYTFHEIGLGIGQEFQLINGLTGGISRLYLGLTPKLMISNSYFEHQYESNYIAQQDGSGWQQTGNSFVRGNPIFNHVVESYGSNAIMPSADGFMPNQLQQMNGYGFGLDVGLNWIFPFGSEITKAGNEKLSAVKYSFRIAASLTDFGFLNFKNPIQEYTIQLDTLAVTTLPLASGQLPHGNPAGNKAFLSEDNASALQHTAPVSYVHDSMLLALPTRVTVSTALQLNFITVMADVSSGWNEMMYNNTHPRLALGTELRLIPFIPVRGGVAIERNRPTRIGLGTGLELPLLVWSVSVQYDLTHVTEYTQPIAGALTSLQFRF